MLIYVKKTKKQALRKNMSKISIVGDKQKHLIGQKSVLSPRDSPVTVMHLKWLAAGPNQQVNYRRNLIL